MEENGESGHLAMWMKFNGRAKEVIVDSVKGREFSRKSSQSMWMSRPYVELFGNVDLKWNNVEEQSVAKVPQNNTEIPFSVESTLKKRKPHTISYNFLSTLFFET